ncbi:MAG: YeiH family protein [Acidimicrobiales bacterium]
MTLVDDLGLDDLPSGPKAPELTRRPDRFSPQRRLVALVPGVAAAAVIAALASVLGGLVPVVGAPVFAIVAGIIVAAYRPPAERLRPGLVFSTKAVLQGSIVVLGLGLSAGQVVSTGESSLPVLLGTLVTALGMAWLAGRALHLGRDLNTLIGVGTAICGASAIAATDAVIGADEADVSYAIATIFTFNVVAVLSFPSLGHLIALSQHAFGLWAGTAINDTSSVVAASTIYGHAAVSYAVVVKLTRTLAIVPISLGLAAWRNRSARQANANPGGTDEDAGLRLSGPRTSAPRARPDLRRVAPLFIVAFLGAVACNTFGLVPTSWHHGLSDLATWMITTALAAIGLSANLSHVRRAGPRPVLLGAVLWATVGIASLVLQLATGTI